MNRPLIALMLLTALAATACDPEMATVLETIRLADDGTGTVEWQFRLDVPDVEVAERFGLPVNETLASNFLRERGMTFREISRDDEGEENAKVARFVVKAAFDGARAGTAQLNATTWVGRGEDFEFKRNFFAGKEIAEKLTTSSGPSQVDEQALRALFSLMSDEMKNALGLYAGVDVNGLDAGKLLTAVKAAQEKAGGPGMEATLDQLFSLLNRRSRSMTDVAVVTKLNNVVVRSQVILRGLILDSTVKPPAPVVRTTETTRVSWSFSVEELLSRPDLAGVFEAKVLTKATLDSRLVIAFLLMCVGGIAYALIQTVLRAKNAVPIQDRRKKTPATPSSQETGPAGGNQDSPE